MHSETRTVYITNDGLEFSDPQDALDHENALKLREVIDDKDCGISDLELSWVCARLVERSSDVMAILYCTTYEE